MATFDSLAGDQRAVLQLVLARRRGYEEIASMLSIASQEVRGRALEALDALGPATEVSDDDRRLIGDYLLGQLPGAAQEEAGGLLERSPAARAWAVALTPVLEPVSVDPLPRIPPTTLSATASASEPAPRFEAESGSGPASPPAAGPPSEPADPAADGGHESGDRPPSSRSGGIVVIALAAAVIIAAIVILLVTHHPHKAAGDLADATHSTATASTSTSTTSSSTSSAVKYLAQINLRPVAAGSKAEGVVLVVREGTTLGIEMVGERIPPNTKQNSYEVWLYSSPSHFEKLGFVSPAVGKKGRFSIVNALPKNAGSYRELIVTTETARKPTHPGPVLLRGTLTGLS